MNAFSEPDAAVLESSLPPQRPRGRGLISAALGLVIFVAGFVGGAATMRAAAPQPLATLDELPVRISGRMQRELGLTDVQLAELETIIRAHQPELRRIRARIFPQMRAELRRTIDEMAAVLTPEQAEAWRGMARRRLEVHFPLHAAPPSGADEQQPSE